eukprot:TRINITY_DN79928_c0_g1_i1.p1 TRINITY_DN79928_c0_g1~~TRINITY_DN79928_c0_g1_i1.p1  ORF type:complete len:170 (-),score=35.91 TRINITY_DN79928_c0_g1_i1:147-620(-)
MGSGASSQTEIRQGLRHLYAKCAGRFDSGDNLTGILPGSVAALPDGCDEISDLKDIPMQGLVPANTKSSLEGNGEDGEEEGDIEELKEKVKDCMFRKCEDGTLDKIMTDISSADGAKHLEALVPPAPPPEGEMASEPQGLQIDALESKPAPVAQGGG